MTVAVTPQFLARLLALGVVAVVIQTAGVSQMPIGGANADLSPLVVMAVGLLAGSLIGACFGFGVGLFVDVALLQTLGVSSLVLLVVGYGAGRVREVRDPEGPLVPLVVGAAATLAFSLGFAVVQFLLGFESAISTALGRQILLTLIVNTLVALPLYALARRWMLPVLPEDPRRRRRRAYTTGGLSPLSRA